MKTLTFFSLLFFAFSSLSTAGTLSLQDALETMRRSNGTLQSAREQITIADYKVRAAKGLRYPEISAALAYSHLNDDLSVDLNEYRDGFSYLLNVPSALLGNWDITLQEQDLVWSGINLVWPVFTGGKITSTINSMKIQKEISTIEAGGQENALISDLVDKYYLLQLAQNCLDVRKRALETADAHLGNAKKMEKQGVISSLETMQAQTAVSDASRELKAAAKDVELGRIALKGVMGAQDLTIDTLTSSLFNYTLQEELPFYQERAEKNYPEIVKAGRMEHLAKEMEKVEKSDNLPTVALLASKNLYTENFALEDYDWFVGVGVTMTLFDGRKTRNKALAAKATARDVALRKEQAEKDIQILAAKYYMEIQKQQEQFAALEDDLVFAKELLRVRKKSFVEGFSSSTDVEDANLHLSAIELERLQALYQMDTTLAKLLEICDLSSTYIQYSMH